MVSYLVRYNWAFVQGAIKPIDEYKGMAYDDMVVVQLNDIDEMALALCKEYHIQYGYIMDNMYYPDMTVMYAKMVNEKAFSSYNDYLNLDEKSQGKYVTDFGKPKPYVYELLTADKQKAQIEERRDGLRNMYRHGGKLNG